MQPEDYVGKYVDITYSDGEGGSGWVKCIEPEDIESGQPPLIVFDYGYAFPILNEASIKEVSPPPGDKGMFNG